MSPADSSNRDVLLGKEMKVLAPRINGFIQKIIEKDTQVKRERERIKREMFFDESCITVCERAAFAGCVIHGSL